MAGHIFPGHTELLAHLTGTKKSPCCWLLQAAGHTRHHAHRPHRRHCQNQPGLVERTIVRAHDTLVKAGIGDPRIGVLPSTRTPASTDSSDTVKKKKKSSPRFAPAWPRLAGRRTSTGRYLFFRAGRGDFDCVVAMYHDQGHDHQGAGHRVRREHHHRAAGRAHLGRSRTAFDIAGTGKADERSLLEACAKPSTSHRNSPRTGAEELIFGESMQSALELQPFIRGLPL